MAVQIVDDVLDVEGKAQVPGKPMGVDLRDGNPSLPVVLALETDPQVRRVFQKRVPPRQEILTALERIRCSGVLATARRIAEGYITQAVDALRFLAPSPYYTRLSQLIDELVDRTA
jgi:geranylgeranyl pyrophosphate synthase